MSEYKEEIEFKDKEKTIQLLHTLPSFCTTFYEGRQMRLSAKTQWNYANKMKIFLLFLTDKTDIFYEKPLTEFTLDDLAKVTPEIARNFVTYINNKAAKPKSRKTNSLTTTDNYIASISAYYNYFIKGGTKLSDGSDFLINPFSTIDRAKREKKQIIYLDSEEQEKYLNTVNSGKGLSDRQLLYHNKNSIRERCIVELLLDTGIRVSELVGIDLEDINLDKCSIFIKRKGSKEDTVYFSDNMKEILIDYLEYRNAVYNNTDSAALFLSSTAKNKGERLSVRSVERIIKKYAVAAKLQKGSKITPHKLRSTFAMDTLEKSGNIELVRKMLGHENITTTNNYAQAQDKDKENNRNIRHTEG